MNIYIYIYTRMSGLDFDFSIRYWQFSSINMWIEEKLIWHLDWTIYFHVIFFHTFSHGIKKKGEKREIKIFQILLYISFHSYFFFHSFFKEILIYFISVRGGRIFVTFYLTGFIVVQITNNNWKYYTRRLYLRNETVSLLWNGRQINWVIMCLLLLIYTYT